MSSKQFGQYWTFALIVKLVISAWLPMFSDETYYWVWSHHLQLSYFDHPPFIAWLLWLGHVLEPLANTVRWPAVIFSHATLIIWFFLLKGRLPENRMKPWLLLALFTPLTGFGSIILTPDLPLIFFWSLALLAMDRSISTKKMHWYVLLGAALGLGFCSKYHAVLFVPMLLLWLTWQRLWKQVRWGGVVLTILCGLVFCAPVLIWNAQNDWASFKFQLNHGFGETPWGMKYFWEYIGSQIGLIFPTVFFAAIWHTRQPKKTGQLTWLPIFSWGPLLFFMISSFRGRVEGNWPIIAYPSLLVLALMGSGKTRWVNATVGIWIAVALALGTHIARPWLPVEEKRLKTYEFTQYEVFAKIAESYRPFYAHTFQIASKIWYELKLPTYKLQGMSRIDFYDSLPEARPKDKVYFFAGEYWNQLPKWAQEEGHKIVKKYPISQQYTLFEVHAP